MKWVQKNHSPKKRLAGKVFNANTKIAGKHENVVNSVRRVAICTGSDNRKFTENRVTAFLHNSTAVG